MPGSAVAMPAQAVAEHIYIEDELSNDSAEPTEVVRHECIRNRVTGVVTELSFYEEGFLGIGESRKHRLTKEHTVELRFLDPDPATSRRSVAGLFGSALGGALLACLAYVVLPATDLAQFTASATIALATISVLSLLLFIYRAETRYEFATVSGQAVVLSLTGSFGCRRRVRQIVDTVRKAIAKAAGEDDRRDQRYLRAEMQAHYKLAETGVITRQACSNGTTLILSKFG